MNSFLASWVPSNLSCFLSKAKKGCARSPILATKQLSAAIHPVNLWTSLSLVGGFKFSMALIFLGFTLMPRPETRKPSSFLDGTPNVHFFGFSLSRCHWRLLNVSLRSSISVSPVFVLTITSSTYASTFRLSWSPRAPWITRWYVLPTLIKTYGILV